MKRNIILTTRIDTQYNLKSRARLISILTIKKMVFSLIAIFLLSFSQNMIAQITLEHTFEGYAGWMGDYYSEQYAFPEDCYFTTKLVSNSYQVKIYNANYSMISNNTYYFSPPDGYQIYMISTSLKLFNTDNYYEFLVTYQKIDFVNYDNTRQKAILYDQSGNIIKDFGTANSVSVQSYLQVVNNQLRLSVHKSFWDGTTTIISQTEIYSVPGVPPVDVANKKTNQYQYQHPYPNPVSSVITLPYQINQGEISLLNIYNINGQLIETKQIDFMFDKIFLNVSNYTKGTYFYEVDGVSKKFIVD